MRLVLEGGKERSWEDERMRRWEKTRVWDGETGGGMEGGMNKAERIGHGA
jgi:hypothetical protein